MGREGRADHSSSPVLRLPGGLLRVPGRPSIRRVSLQQPPSGLRAAPFCPALGSGSGRELGLVRPGPRQAPAVESAQDSVSLSQEATFRGFPRSPSGWDPLRPLPLTLSGDLLGEGTWASRLLSRS